MGKEVRDRWTYRNKEKKKKKRTEHTNEEWGC